MFSALKNIHSLVKLSMKKKISMLILPFLIKSRHLYASMDHFWTNFLKKARIKTKVREKLRKWEHCIMSHNFIWLQAREIEIKLKFNPNHIVRKCDFQRHTKCNPDLIIGSVKCFDFYIFLLVLISKDLRYKQICWTILVNICPTSGAV